VWPPAPDDGRPALVVAARHGLVDGDRVGTTALGEDPGAVIRAASFDGLSGFLATAISDGALESDEHVAGDAVQAWRRALVATVRVEALVVRVAALLHGAAVRWRLTKGAAIAHLDYPEQVAQRTFGDADIVIHAGDWRRALDVLGAAGYRRPSPELRPGFDVRFGKGATLVDDEELEVDLHLRFAIGRFGVRARMEQLFGRGDRVELGGRVIPTLDGPDRLLHACHHLALGGFSGLRVARDVAQLLVVADVDWRRTVATADDWGVTAVVARGIVEAWDRLALDTPHPAVDWAREYPIGRGDRRAIAVFEGDRPFREQALTAVPALPPWRVPGYLAALAVPDVGARRSGERSAVAHARSRLRKLLGRS